MCAHSTVRVTRTWHSPCYYIPWGRAADSSRQALHSSCFLREDTHAIAPDMTRRRSPSPSARSRPRERKPRTREDRSFEQRDANRDGLLSRDEYVSTGGHPGNFRALDRNSDGMLTRDEFGAARRRRTSAPLPLRLHPPRTPSHSLDRNGDGSLTYGEWTPAALTFNRDRPRQRRPGDPRRVREPARPEHRGGPLRQPRPQRRRLAGAGASSAGTASSSTARTGTTTARISYAEYVANPLPQDSAGRALRRARPQQRPRDRPLRVARRGPARSTAWTRTTTGGSRGTNT